MSFTVIKTAGGLMFTIDTRDFSPVPDPELAASILEVMLDRADHEALAAEHAAFLAAGEAARLSDCTTLLHLGREAYTRAAGCRCTDTDHIGACLAWPYQRGDSK